MFVSVNNSNTTHLVGPKASLEHPDVYYIPALNAPQQGVIEKFY